MPYNRKDDYYHWGRNFSRDGSDYNSSYDIGITFVDILAGVMRQEGEQPSYGGRTQKKRSPIKRFVIIITGKIYKGRSEIAGTSKLIDRTVISDTAINGGNSIERQCAYALGLTDGVPEHVTYIELRPIRG